jgi:hypothetical protein
MTLLPSWETNHRHGLHNGHFHDGCRLCLESVRNERQSCGCLKSDPRCAVWNVNGRCVGSRTA